MTDIVRPRVVVVAPTENELKAWVEREHLKRVDGPEAWWINAEETVLGLISGTTAAGAAVGLMAAGLDPRFDFSRSYWLLQGIAGVNLNFAPVGSVAWVRRVVGDVAREIDVRESPAGWPEGVFPLGSASPRPERYADVPWMRGNVFVPDEKTVAWAIAMTGDVELANGARVMPGDVLASDRVWHGARINQWATGWVALHGGQFAMAAMEDVGWMYAVEKLASMRRIDARRVMLLRAGSNATMPLDGTGAAASAIAPLSGATMAMENLWRVGNPVVRWLVAHWDVAAATVPGI